MIVTPKVDCDNVKHDTLYTLMISISYESLMPFIKRMLLGVGRTKLCWELHGNTARKLLSISIHRHF